MAIWFGTEGGDTFAASLEESYAIYGLAGDDRLTGSGFGDWIEGGEGNDGLEGLAGNDVLIAGNGNDVLRGGLGDDVLLGAHGANILYGDVDSLYGFVPELLPGGNDWIQGGKGQNVLVGGAGNDTLIGGGFEEKTYAPNQTLNQSWGGSGDDLIVQAVGRGYLWGDAGNDTLWGAMGEDYLHGGTGSDDMIGLGGNDLFLFYLHQMAAGDVDTIHGFGDYGTGQDRIELPVSARDVIYSDEALGVRLSVMFGAGQSQQIFVYGMSKNAIQDDVEFLL